MSAEALQLIQLIAKAQAKAMLELIAQAQRDSGAADVTPYLVGYAAGVLGVEHGTYDTYDAAGVLEKAKR